MSEDPEVLRRRALWVAFEDHHDGCEVCSIMDYCPEGTRLKGLYETQRLLDDQKRKG